MLLNRVILKYCTEGGGQRGIRLRPYTTSTSVTKRQWQNISWKDVANSNQQQQQI